MKHYLYIVALIFILFITNNYLTFDQGISFMKASDTLSYKHIADHAPSIIPNIAGKYHHDQRFLFPYLSGVISKFIHLVIVLFRLTTFLIMIIIVFMLNQIMFFWKISSTERLLYVTLYLFNPYSFRYYLSVPAMVIDLFFVLGLTIILYGLIKNRWPIIYSGLIVAIFSRQTTLLLLPVIIYWVWINKKSKPRLKILQSILIVATTLTGYLVCGYIASTYFMDINQNSESILGLIKFLFSNFDLKTFLDFCLRAITPFLILFGFWLSAVTKKKIKLDTTNTALLIMSLSILIQPFLGGPLYTGSNITRLNALALIPLILFLAYSLKSNGLKNSRRLTFFIIIIIIGSFHHMTSIASAMSFSSAVFLIISIATAIIFGITYAKSI